MEIDFDRGTRIMKVLADDTRARIVHILSCGERCAGELQAYFNITQPTLSHHMASLVAEGLVESRHESRWVYYSLVREPFDFLSDYAMKLSTESETCLCKKIPARCRGEDTNQDKNGSGHERKE